MAKHTVLDRTDRTILTVLAKNARISNKDLATLVGLAPSSCLERVRALRREGVLRGEHADIDPRSLGIGLQAMIAIRLTRHSRRLVEQFQAHVAQLPQVLAVYHVAGENDFLVHVAASDAEDLRNFALDAFTTQPDVAHIETWLIFAHQRNPLLPDYVDD